MSDYSDTESPEYVSFDDREETIGNAIDAAELLIRINMPIAWEFITSEEEKSGDSDPDDAMEVIRAFKEFCKQPTNYLYEDSLTKDIVNNLVASTLETQHRLEEFVDGKFRSPFWTSLIQTLKDRYEEEEERIEQERERDEERRRLRRRASGQMGRSVKRTRRVSSIILRF